MSSPAPPRVYFRLLLPPAEAIEIESLDRNAQRRADKLLSKLEWMAEQAGNRCMILDPFPDNYLTGAAIDLWRAHRISLLRTEGAAIAGASTLLATAVLIEPSNFHGT
jgi:hypothetical protein